MTMAVRPITRMAGVAQFFVRWGPTMALLAGTLAFVGAGEAPPPPQPLKPAPNISAACLAKAGPKQNTR